MNHWRKTKIYELCDISSSKRIYASEYQASGVPFYRGKEIIEKHQGNIDVSTQIFITEEKYKQIESKFGIPDEGDLLLTSVGTLGIPYIVKSYDRFYFKDGNLTWFKSFQGLESQYLYYWILSPLGKAELQRCTIGSSQSAFTIVLLKQMEILLPPLETQRKIAAILSAYDDLIENNTRRIKALEQAAHDLYREWFVEFRFPGHESVPMIDSGTEYGMIPQGWEVVSLGDVAEVNTSSIRKGEDIGNIEYIDISSVSRGQIDETRIMPFEDAPSRARRKVSHGDTIWATVRPNRRQYALILHPAQILLRLQALPSFPLKLFRIHIFTNLSLRRNSQII